ncbi:MAG: TraR/DksA C4-type zinc finger protein [Planctomycetota bacterium]|nr:MAG: TraR/DksA C4-type zinc finger protein [Planctomycetota bacterium]
MRRSNQNLTTAEIRRFKATLLAKRQEILADVITMEHETLRRESTELSRLPIHMADAGTDNYEVENTLGLMDSERKLLADIDDALQRIEDGTYGICQGSGKPIPRQRLDAIPWARYCVEYASLLEKRRMPKLNSSDLARHDYGEEEYDEESGKSYRRAQ